MNWKHVSLGEISVNIQTGPFGSQLHQSDYSEKGTPVVMPKDLISGHISEESIARVSDDHVERLSRHKIEVGDILYSRRQHNLHRPERARRHRFLHLFRIRVFPLPLHGNDEIL